MSPYVWLAVAAVAAIVEAVSAGLITMWFVIGALVSFAIAFFGGPLWLQLVVFIVVSVVCLVLLRPVVLKYRTRGESHESTPIGQSAIVVEAIGESEARGRVRTPDRMTWAAVSADGSAIEEGAEVRVVDQRSVKLVVERDKGVNNG